MSTKQKAVKEARAQYRARHKRSVKPTASKVALRWSEIENLAQPIVLKHNGEPVAVVVKYADYQRMGSPQTERRQAAWRELDALLARVHARTETFSAEEIETDITTARQEARKQRNASRRR